MKVYSYVFLCNILHTARMIRGYTVCVWYYGDKHLLIVRVIAVIL